MIRTALAVIALQALVCSSAAASLTPAQSKLIDLLTYIQVSRDNCGYLIDVDVLRLTAAREGISFGTPDEQRALADGFANADQAFSGIRRTVECAYALERFGPNGSEMPGLVNRRPSGP